MNHPHEPIDDPAALAGADQADAATSDLLRDNGLELVEGWPFEAGMIDGLSAAGLLEALSASAMKAEAEGSLLVIAAYPIDAERYSRIAMVVRRRAEGM